MKKRMISLIILLIILVGTLGFISNNLAKKYITGSAIEDFQYSYTKAICNETNFCQDYEIVCKGNGLVRQTPVTGAFLQQDAGWKDPRDKDAIKKIC
ncbi:MAG TPA: hypothetical protein ENG87_03190 [Candidatus Pacearchaeota archaeon]|nr:hypothetical protein BMS3Abin17_00130 [archaeon BMS3Abin17]HDK42358.1 hypothetical protein [Candidatus Pacearchaeota archaeon]HDZ60278.1 hypothetical protein [Candidatus Pacearchaeota archaeon]